MGAPAYAIVPAAGSGTRLGFNQPKAFVDLGGRTILERCLDGLADSAAFDGAVVLTSEDMLDCARDILSRPDNRRRWDPLEIDIALGGAERIDSVLAGLRVVAKKLGWSLPGNADSAPAEVFDNLDQRVLVAVHDAARCLTPPQLIRDCVHAADEGAETGAWSGVVPTLPVADTIKRVDIAPSGPAAGMLVIEDTPPRHTLRAAQTPQVCSLAQLLKSNRQYQDMCELASAHPTLSGEVVFAATDDSSLMELAGLRMIAVEGSPWAMKITTPQDYDMAQMLLAPRAGDYVAGTIDGAGTATGDSTDGADTEGNQRP